MVMGLAAIARNLVTGMHRTFVLCKIIAAVFITATGHATFETGIHGIIGPARNPNIRAQCGRFDHPTDREPAHLPVLTWQSNTITLLWGLAFMVQPLRIRPNRQASVAS